MKKTSSRKTARRLAGNLRPEYRFDYSRARPNPFANQLRHGSVTVVLDPDVAEVFPSSEAVNALLRSVISALPATPRGKAAATNRRATSPKTRQAGR